MSRREELLHELPFGVDYAKSARASCKYCNLSIPKGELRLSVRYPKLQFRKMQDNWLHERCFWPGVRKDELSEATIYGFEALKWEDQEMLREKILLHENDIKRDEERVGALDEYPIMGDDDAMEKFPLVSTGKVKEALKEQSEILDEIKEELSTMKLKVDEYDELLQFNDYYIREDDGVTELIEILADFIVFGVPLKCLKCKEGSLFYNYTLHSYKCDGINGEKACTFDSTNPKRDALKIPEKWAKNGFLEGRKLPMLKKRSYPPGADVRIDTVTDYPRDRIRRPA